MKKKLQIFILILTISVLFSCSENPFMVNLFSGIDVYTPPESFDNVNDVLSEAGDDGFLDALAEDGELADQVIDLLDDVLTEDPATATSDDQDAALLLADVYLATTDADDTVNNVNGLLSALVTGGDDAPNMDDPTALIPDLFQLDDSLTPEEQTSAVKDQLASFLGAADALEFYGDTIDGQGASEEVNAGETAATAMIAGMSSFLVENAEDNLGNPLTEEQAIEAIAAAIVDPDNNDMPTIAEPTDENGDPLPEDATMDEMLDAVLGDGLAAVVGEGFDLSAMENM